MAESLSVKYRPKTFEEVSSQTTIIRILRKQIELEKFSNAYLFCGPSGCGKTTTARIFAREINKHQGSPIEIDAASNNGVDNVRRIRDEARERSLDSKYKIFIIDECHSLTKDSWNVFLKVLEEPPQFTIFIFCTTDPHKILDTVSNRCMRFNFTRIDAKHIENRLAYICEKEGFTNYQDTVQYISKICKGQMRDGISYLEKVASYDTDVNIDNCIEALGNFSYHTLFKLINCIIDKNLSGVFEIVDNFYLTGGDLKQFVEQLLNFCTDLLKYSLLKDTSILEIPGSMKQDIEYVVNIQDAPNYYMYVVDKLLELKFKLQKDSNPKNTINISLANILRGK